MFIVLWNNLANFLYLRLIFVVRRSSQAKKQEQSNELKSSLSRKRITVSMQYYINR